MGLHATLRCPGCEHEVQVAEGPFVGGDAQPAFCERCRDVVIVERGPAWPRMKEAAAWERAAMIATGGRPLEDGAKCSRCQGTRLRTWTLRDPSCPKCGETMRVARSAMD